MIPGMGKVDPRQMRLAMKRMGMQTEEIDDVSEVIIRTKTKEYRFERPAVVMVKVQGQQIYQVSGEPKVSDAGLTTGTAAMAPAGPVIAQEDIDLVASQTGCTPDEARQALMQTEGQPADAIIRILTKK